MQIRHFSGLGVRAIVLTLCVLPLLVVAGTKEDAAAETAKAWLELVDQGKYGASWKEAAPLFQGQVTEKAWEKLVAGVRKPLGAFRSRELASAVFSTSLPGAPDGEYVVVQFQSSFANKAEAVETVTPMLDQGVWKVSGYFIR